MKITLCSSSKFFNRLKEIKKDLEAKGHKIFLPSMQDCHHLKEDALIKVKFNLIKDHFQKIAKSNAIYVANYDQKGIEGYIGGNVFLEMGIAFYREIPIFLLNNIPKKISYKDELLALKPIVVGKNWDKIDKSLSVKRI